MVPATEDKMTLSDKDKKIIVRSCLFGEQCELVDYGPLSRGSAELSRNIRDFFSTSISCIFEYIPDIQSIVTDTILKHGIKEMDSVIEFVEFIKSNFDSLTKELLAELGDVKKDYAKRESNYKVRIETERKEYEEAMEQARIDNAELKKGKKEKRSKSKKDKDPASGSAKIRPDKNVKKKGLF